MKQELAQILSEEYQRIPLNINRNSFVNKIAIKRVDNNWKISFFKMPKIIKK